MAGEIQHQHSKIWEGCMVGGSTVQAEEGSVKWWQVGEA